MCSLTRNRLSHIFSIMATRSRIGIELKDGSSLSAYHHWDGYPQWLGRILNTQYKTREQAADLIDCLLYTSPSPRDATLSRMPSSA